MAMCTPKTRAITINAMAARHKLVGNEIVDQLTEVSCLGTMITRLWLDSKKNQLPNHKSKHDVTVHEPCYL